MNFEEMGNLYLLRDLEMNRKAALARVRSSIVEMQAICCQQMPPGNPQSNTSFGGLPFAVRFGKTKIS
jgi:hypothetical protein